MKRAKNIFTSVVAIATFVMQGVFSHAQPAPSRAASATEVIRTFQVHFSDEDLNDLRNRIKATKWPDAETVDDNTQGVPLATMKKLAAYWANGYDWRKIETRLNNLPQFVTTIDNVAIHFIHIRSKHKNALPVIITHGWPGSVIEQLKIIDPLINPTAYGGKAEDAFDVIIPSIPGYGFSGKPAQAGWDPVHIAKAWIELMKRLGYKKFVAQGGDWGDAISEQMALLAPPELLGIHTNMAATVPPGISKALKYGEPQPAGLSTDEKHAYEQLDFFFKHGLGYATEMGTRPQTLYAIGDSPIGLAAWILDHDARSLELITRVFNEQSEGLTKDDVLDNITLYWLTKTAVSSGRLFWESKLAFFDVKHINIPVAVSAFPDEIYTAPRSWAQQAFPKLIHYNKLEKGGHFAAWEQPDLFVKEIRTAFRSLR
jgi:pimeloyl-ACP methyl ester carboxylesterase